MVSRDRHAVGDSRHPGPRLPRLPDPHTPAGVLPERRAPPVHAAPRGDGGQGMPHHSLTALTLFHHMLFPLALVASSIKIMAFYR